MSYYRRRRHGRRTKEPAIPESETLETLQSPDDELLEAGSTAQVPAIVFGYDTPQHQQWAQRSGRSSSHGGSRKHSRASSQLSYISGVIEESDERQAAGGLTVDEVYRRLSTVGLDIAADGRSGTSALDASLRLELTDSEARGSVTPLPVGDARKLSSDLQSKGEGGRSSSLVAGDLRIATSLFALPNALKASVGMVKGGAPFQKCGSNLNEAVLEALRNNSNLGPMLRAVLLPLIRWRSLFSAAAGATKVRIGLFYSLLSLVNGLGLALSFRCTMNSEDSSSVFGAGPTARALLLVHYTQGFVCLYYVYKTDLDLGGFFERWLAAYMTVRVEKKRDLRPMRRWGVGMAALSFGGTVVFTAFRAVSDVPYLEEKFKISFPTNCSDLFVKEELTPVLGPIFVGVSSLPSMYCLGLFGLLCAILNTEFGNLYRRFNDQIHTSKVPDKDLAKFREQHYKLIKLTDFADGMVSYYALWVFALNMPALCLVSYALMRSSTMSSADFRGFVFWAAQLFLQMTIVSIAPAFPSYKAHQVMDILEEFANKDPNTEKFHEEEDDEELRSGMGTVRSHDSASFRMPHPLELAGIMASRSAEEGEEETVGGWRASRGRSPASGPSGPGTRPPSAAAPPPPVPDSQRSYVEPGGWMSQEVYQQLVLFSQQLTGKVIGLSCGGFFLLTKEMLLTLASVLVTYFALIIQMDMSASVCNCACNKTLATTPRP